MDTLFLAVTGLSLLLVLIMAVILAKLLRDERQRSEARVAALLTMSADRSDEDRAPQVADRSSKVAARTAHVAPRGSQAAARNSLFASRDSEQYTSQTHTRAHQPVREEADELELRPSDAEVAAPMFAQPERSAAWGRRLAIIMPLALIITGAGLAFYPSQRDIGAPAPSPAAAPARTMTPMPLELLSLRHTQQAESLTVTGLVQNPRGGAAVSKVFATAFVFGTDGNFLASGRAPLDFTKLAPGDESPFVVTVPVKGEVARYRIGFRGEDGRVIAHVDRRAGGTLARVSGERP